MEPYREGTLLRDCLGDLWMIADYCKNPMFHSAGNHCYVMVRLKDQFRCSPVFRLVHLEYDLVTEA